MAAADPSGEDDSGFEADCESITSQFEEFFATSPTSSTIEAGDRGFIPLERVRARNVDGSGAARRGKMSTIAKAIAATGTIGTSIGQAVTLIASSKGRILFYSLRIAFRVTMALRRGMMARSSSQLQGR
jgi:hypothetical protein